MGRPKGSKNKKKYTCDAGGCYTDSDSCCSDSDCSDCYETVPKKKRAAKKSTAKPKSKSSSKSKPKKKASSRRSRKDSSTSCSCSDCMDDYSSSDDSFECGRGGFKCPLK